MSDSVMINYNGFYFYCTHDKIKVYLKSIRRKEEAVMYIPKISSEWRLLFKPEKHGNYVNDHCMIQDANDSWHLFGITSHEKGPDTERYFVHASTISVNDIMEEKGKVIDDGNRAWAPCIVEESGIYYMYYGPGVTKMAVTHELSHWMGHQINIIGNPVMSVNRDHMIIKVKDTWLMYASGVKDGYSCISLLTSNDLINWRFEGYALTSSGSAPLNPPWGAFESPFVLEYEGMYYLFTTYTDCGHENYHNTLVFCSGDPYHFGDYTLENHDEMVVSTLKSHAGEIIYDNEKYYITTCGWNDFDIPFEGGVAIAELRFDPKI